MKIQKKFFKINMIMFVAFGLIAFMGLYETTPMQMIESQITGRNPASVVTTLKSTEVLNIDCSDFEQEITVPAHHVRLEGYLCDKIPDEKKMQIQNLTTGKEATLFNRGKTKYMTDFIQLVDGKNQISLSYELKDQKIRKVALTLIK